MKFLFVYISNAVSLMQPTGDGKFSPNIERSGAGLRINIDLAKLEKISYLAARKTRANFGLKF